MVQAFFTDGVDVVTAQGLTQWDYGQTLEIHGLTLPASFQVHFASKKLTVATVVLGSTVGGVGRVPIPDAILEKDTDLLAWIYIVGDGTGETIKLVQLPITTRLKPADWIEPVTPSQQTMLEQLVNDVNEAVADLEAENAQFKADVETEVSTIQGGLDGKANLNHTHGVSDISGVLPISKGGTGASTVEGAKQNLGIGDIDVGGRNILLDTDFMIEIDASQSSPVLNELAVSDSIDLNSLIGRSLAFSFEKSVTGEKSEIGSPETEGLFGMSVTFQWADLSGENPDIETEWNDFVQYDDMTGERRFEVVRKLEAPSGYDTLTYIGCVVNLHCKPAVGNTAVWTCGFPKIEIGSVATDWTPNPDDKANVVHQHNLNSLNGTLSVEKGGTGADNAEDALENLGAAAVSHSHGMSDLNGTLPISKGGTGATDAASALENLGAMPKSGGNFSGSIGVEPAGAGDSNRLKYFTKYNSTNPAQEVIGFNGSDSSRVSRLGFRQYSWDSITKAPNNGYEDYLLPAQVEDSSEPHEYEILTSKQAITIAQGGTGATTKANARTNLGIEIETGYVASVGTSGVNVDFGTTFSGVPSVVATCASATLGMRVADITTTGFKLYCSQSNGKAYWQAIYIN